MNRLTAGQGWALLALYVILFDLTCRDGQMLSEGADRALERYPRATAAGIAMVALHLGNCLDPRYDVIHQLTRLWR